MRVARPQHHRPPIDISQNAVAKMVHQELNDISKDRLITDADIKEILGREAKKGNGTLSKDAVEAMASIADSFDGKLDDGAKQLAARFQEIYYTDMMAPLSEEYARQAAQQLKQDKVDFQDFLQQDLKEHKKLTYDEFKENLQDKRLDASEWETMMLWLQMGVKKKPITS